MTPDVHLVGSEKIVVTENDRVVGGSFTTVEAAEAKAHERKKIAEASGQPAPRVEVKQTLYG
jgi:hypothetical protein